MSRPRPAAPSRIGSAFFALGCLSVLGMAFAAGMYAGRSWPALLAWVGPRQRGDAAAHRPGEPRPAAPMLTFYEELAAPLTPSPLPPRPRVARPSAPAAGDHPGGAGRPALAASGPDAEPVRPVPFEAGSGGPVHRTRGPAGDPAARFTVQVGAFAARGPADALRARLVAAGLDAYVAAVDAQGATRYRVRVGSYPTREEARQVASRLAADRQVSTSYVTTR